MNRTSQSGGRTLYTIGASGIVLLFAVPALHLSAEMQKVAFLVITLVLCCGLSLWVSDSHEVPESSSLELSHLGPKGYYTLNPGRSSPNRHDTLTNGGEKETA